MSIKDLFMYYSGAFVASSIMLAFALNNPDSLHWYTSLIWLAAWIAFEITLYFIKRWWKNRPKRNTKSAYGMDTYR